MIVNLNISHKKSIEQHFKEIFKFFISMLDLNLFLKKFFIYNFLTFSIFYTSYKSISATFPTVSYILKKNTIAI